jgi:CHASE1-domain containing sensor protein
MTVEEWIRYQIEVEQDRFKFKRDGERELERFKKRVEEVRKAIESL